MSAAKTHLAELIPVSSVAEKGIKGTIAAQAESNVVGKNTVNRYNLNTSGCSSGARALALETTKGDFCNIIYFL